MADFHQTRSNERSARDFNGAAVIDAEGREIPITEEMVTHTLERLAEAWENRHRAVEDA